MSLHDVCRNNQTAELLSFIAAGADLNTRDKHSRTPLMLAAYSNACDCIDILLANGAHVSLAAVDDVNALHFSAMKGHAGAAKHLLASGGLAVDCRTRKGQTALALAAQGGHVELVQLLLKKRANPLATDIKQKSILDLCKTDECRSLIQQAVQEAKGRAEEKAVLAREEGGAGAGEKRKERPGIRGGTLVEKAAGQIAELAQEEGLGGNQEEGVKVAGPSQPPETRGERDQGLAGQEGGDGGGEQQMKKQRTKQPLLSFGDVDD